MHVLLDSELKGNTQIIIIIVVITVPFQKYFET